MVLIATADGTPEAVVLTDMDGAFELDVTPGVYVVHVRHRGYRPVSSERLELTEGRTIEVRINLRPVALQLDAVTVYGDDPYDGFLDRYNDTLGFTMMAEDFEEYHVKQMHEVLGAMPMIHRPRCYRAYLDGFPVPEKSGWVDLIFSPSYSLNAESVYGVEVYRTRREAPKQYRYFLAPDCGVILVWTKRGRR
jgi:Carboxypeptidase regulatory-like domain